MGIKNETLQNSQFLLFLLLSVTTTPYWIIILSNIWFLIFGKLLYTQTNHTAWRFLSHLQWKSPKTTRKYLVRMRIYSDIRLSKSTSKWVITKRLEKQAASWNNEKLFHCFCNDLEAQLTTVHTNASFVFLSFPSQF